MSTSLIRKKSTNTNQVRFYKNRVNYWLSPHEGDIPAFDSAVWVPTGSIMAFTMSTSPPGWLICDGTEISRPQYAALFSVIGTTFGIGNGVDTFNLPDYRGAFLRGTGTGPHGYSGPALNQSQADALKIHDHTATSTVTDPGHAHTQQSANDDFNNTSGNGTPPNYGYPPESNPSFAAYDSGGRSWSNINSNTTGVTVETAVDASGNATETRPYNYGIYWIIKL